MLSQPSKTTILLPFLLLQTFGKNVLILALAWDNDENNSSCIIFEMCSRSNLPYCLAL